ncbi:hypothetical protein NG799_24190 [Laspinema sp. D1]|uniref:Uncharacterized protein n=1 Tax=Laspinema palackyanum D2a TaxID=2953684 RepID=A0ABT2MZV1_9CYAN|nr:hypothetical protein [Laspinema sp. D2a]
MSDSQTPENSSIVPQPSGRVVSVDEFKSLFYQLNAKPDTEIRLLPGKKNLELADIRSINDQISAKLRNHDLVSDIASINFILYPRKIKDYCIWAEFERENWDTVNEKVRSITIKWDIAIKLPQYQLPQRHSLKIRIGTEIPPKDIFQLILTSDDIGELMEARATSICKVDFVNDILAAELMNIVGDWHEGLDDLPETNFLSSFLAKNGKFLSQIIRYSSPIVLLIIFYQYYDFLMPWIGIQSQITIKSLEALLIWLTAIFVAGTFLGRKVEICIDKRIDRLEEYPQFSITRGDKKAVDEFEKTNKKLTYQIVARFLWVVFSLVVTSSIKFVIQYFS